MSITENSPAKEQNPLPTLEFTEEDLEKTGDTEFKTFSRKLLINNEKYVKQAFKEFKEYVTLHMNQMKADMPEMKNTVDQIESIGPSAVA